jgi:hypothetical protein
MRRNFRNSSPKKPNAKRRSPIKLMERELLKGEKLYIYKKSGDCLSVLKKKESNVVALATAK